MLDGDGDGDEAVDGLNGGYDRKYVSIHAPRQSGYLPPGIVLPSLKPVDTMQVGHHDDEAYCVGKTAAGREVFDDKGESGTDINGKPATSTLLGFIIYILYSALLAPSLWYKKP